jgi:hypothetical protein
MAGAAGQTGICPTSAGVASPPDRVIASSVSATADSTVCADAGNGAGIIAMGAPGGCRTFRDASVCAVVALDREPRGSRLSMRLASNEATAVSIPFMPASSRALTLRGR